MTNPATDWRKVAARMRGDLDRADLNGRARRLAEFAIKGTLMAGRTRVVIPNRMELCRLLKIGKNHVAEVLAALVSSRILAVKEIADGWELLVFPDSAQWDVEWLFAREEMTAFLSDLNRAPGQCQGELIEPLPDLNRTLAEVSAERASSQNGNHAERGCSQNGNRKTPANGGGVPKMGTALLTSKLKESKIESFEYFDSLKGAVMAIEGTDEWKAVEGFRQILGQDVMTNDGGKWRNRWRTQRSKVHRVFAAAVEDIAARKVRSTGAHAEYLWKQFAD